MTIKWKTQRKLGRYAPDFRCVFIYAVSCAARQAAAAGGIYLVFPTLQSSFRAVAWAVASLALEQSSGFCRQ